MHIQSTRVASGLLAGLMSVFLGATIAQAATYTWAPTGAGPFNWNNAGPQTNWTYTGSPAPPTFPNAAGDIADVRRNISAAQTINLNENIVIGQLLIGDTGSSYFASTIEANGGSLTFNSGTASPAILSKQGGNNSANVVNINAPITVQGTLQIYSTTNSNLTLNGALLGTSSATIDTTLVPVDSGRSIQFKGDLSGFEGTIRHVQGPLTDAFQFVGTTAASYDASKATFELNGASNTTGMTRIVNQDGATFKIGRLSGTGGYIRDDLNSALADQDMTLEVGHLGGAPATWSGVFADQAPSGPDPGSTGNFRKVGTGALTLAGTNLYKGTTTVSAGSLIAGTAGAFGTGTSAIILGDAGTGFNDVNLLVGGAFSVARAVHVTNNGTGVVGIGGIGTSNNSSSAFSGLITFDRDITIGQRADNGRLNLTGGLTAGTAGAKTITFGSSNIVEGVPGVVTFLGDVTVSSAIIEADSFVSVNVNANIVSFSGNNDYSGNTTIATGGRLRASNGNGIPNGPGKGNLLMNTGSQFGIIASETINGLSGDGLIESESSSVPAFLTIGDNNASSAFNGLISNGGGLLHVIKTGSGTLTLGGANTYEGNTTITGTNSTLALAAGGSFANSPIITVGDLGSSGAVLDLSAKSSYTFGSGQTLQGIGTVNGPTASLTIDGTVAPGNSTGVLSLIGNVILNGTLLAEVDDPNSTPLNDLLAITGDLLLTGSSILNLPVTNVYDPGATYDLVTYSGSLSGVFDPSNILNLPASHVLEYGSGTNSSISLVPVPEPGSMALILVGLSGIGVIGRRKQK